MIMKLLLCAVAAHALQGPQVRRTRTSLKATRTESILQHLEGEGDGLGAGAAASSTATARAIAYRALSPRRHAGP